MRLEFVSGTPFFAYPTQKEKRVWMLWDEQPNAIPMDELIFDTLGAYEAVLLGEGMVLRRDPAWGSWQNRFFALSSGDYFNIWVEEMVFFWTSEDVDVRKIRKSWDKLLTSARRKTKTESPPTELEAPPSLTRMTLGELKQRSGFLGQVVRGVRARHVIVRESPGRTYLVCLYGPDEILPVWSCYPDAVQVWVEPPDYWMKVCETQWQRIAWRHPEILDKR